MSDNPKKPEGNIENESRQRDGANPETVAALWGTKTRVEFEKVMKGLGGKEAVKALIDLGILLLFKPEEREKAHEQGKKSLKRMEFAGLVISTKEKPRTAKENEKML